MKQLQLVLIVGLVATLVGVTYAKPTKEPSTSFQSVENHEGHVREGPRFLAEILFTATFAEQLEVLDSLDGWLQVRRRGDKEVGWIHASAMTYQEIILRPADKKTKQRLRKGDMALAGRGFREDAERSYRKKHTDLEPGFTWLDEHVDQDPVYSPSVLEIALFRAEGALTTLAEDPS
jgi:hypothetical protein